MSVITHQFIQDLGLELDEETFASLAEHADTTLRERILNEIVEELTPEQAEELATLDGVEDETLQQWLVNNVPDLQEIVADEVDILLGEIAEGSDTIQQG
ncbi:MAG: DUF5663 domain-containing protein [Candidatus Saccharimonas sp.]